MPGKSDRQPPSYLAARVAKVRSALGKVLDGGGLLVTNFADVSWLTGFEGDDSYALITTDRVILISDFRYQEQIANEAAWVTAVMRPKLIATEVARQAGRLKLKRLAVQAESLTLAQKGVLDQELKSAIKGKRPRLVALKNVINAEREGKVVEPHEDALESAPIPIP